MGIPLFFKIISEKYDDTLIDSIQSQQSENYLFLDMNCLIHPCCRKVLDDNYTNSMKLHYEKRMFTEIKHYLEKIVDFCSPKFIYLGIDGVAPCAKMTQQRLRRFKTFMEKEEINKIKDQLNIDYSNISWDTNAISPGTDFMISLSKFLQHFILTDPLFKNIEVVFSDHSIPGEGEHKILNYIKQNEFDNDPNIIIYGLDADLIMLSLVSNSNNVYLMREAIQFGKPQEGNFLYMDIDQLKCNIIQDFKERYFMIADSVNSEYMIKPSIFNYLIDDYIFICFFLGNDFLPHILSLDLRHEGLNIIMDTYVKIYTHLQVNLITDKINTQFLNLFLKELSLQEDSIVNKLFSKRKKFKKYLRFRPTETEYDRRLEVLNNFPILNMKEELLITEPNLYTEDWRKRYYFQCFNITEKEEIDDVCKNYLDGLFWTYKYYFSGCVSWSWNYKYNHSPTLKDLSNYLDKNIEDINSIKFKKDKPVSPIVQLMTIFPKNSANLIPQNYHKLFNDIEGGLLHYYPTKYELDILFKRYYWQCIPKLPPIDLDLIKKKVNSIKTSQDIKNKFKLGVVINKRI